MNRLPLSYYELLNVSPKASDDEVKAAYRRLALRYHPDRNPESRGMAQLRFQQISEAYHQIKTRERRKHYNRILKTAMPDNAANNDNMRTQRRGFFSDLAMFFRGPSASDNSVQHDGSEKRS